MSSVEQEQSSENLGKLTLVDKEQEQKPLEEVSKKLTNDIIPPEMAIRHPLQSRWALWYLKGDKLKQWEECLKIVSVFDTVEDFWA